MTPVKNGQKWRIELRRCSRTGTRRRTGGRWRFGRKADTNTSCPTTNSCRRWTPGPSKSPPSRCIYPLLSPGWSTSTAYAPSPHPIGPPDEKQMVALIASAAECFGALQKPVPLPEHVTRGTMIVRTRHQWNQERLSNLTDCEARGKQHARLLALQHVVRSSS
eukprot:686778-Prorocentrum_minimum.AAC.2